MVNQRQLTTGAITDTWEWGLFRTVYQFLRLFLSPHMPGSQIFYSKEESHNNRINKGHNHNYSRNIWVEIKIMTLYSTLLPSIFWLWRFKYHNCSVHVSFIHLPWHLMPRSSLLLQGFLIKQCLLVITGLPCHYKSFFLLKVFLSPHQPWSINGPCRALKYNRTL